MKFIVKNFIVLYIISFIIGILYICSLSSCSAEYHYTKAINKGMHVDDSKDTIRIAKIDSIAYMIPGKDSIIYIPVIKYADTVINVKDYIFPKSKLEVRKEYKLAKKIVKENSEVKQDSIKETAKTERVKAKQETKQKKSNWKFWIGLIIGVIVTLLFTKKIK
jgi:hypothetical protein